MERISRWIQTSTPLMKMLMAVSVTTIAVVVHRNFYAPYARRQRYRQAEEWANMIIEQEERGDDGPNNISY